MIQFQFYSTLNVADSVAERNEIKQEGDSGGEIAPLAEKVDTI